MTLVAARARGIAVDETAAREQLRVVAATLEGRREAALVGSEINETAGNILMALAASNHPADLATDAMAYFLRMRQQADGRWRPLVIDHRPPINSGDIEVTAVAIRRCARMRRSRIGRSTSAPPNAAPPGCTACRHERPTQRAFQLLGLVWGGIKRDDEKLRAAAKQLLGEQRADGGWSQLPTLESDAFATGQTLVALREAGAIAVTDAAYQRRCDFSSAASSRTAPGTCSRARSRSSPTSRAASRTGTISGYPTRRRTGRRWRSRRQCRGQSPRTGHTTVLLARRGFRARHPGQVAPVGHA